MGCAQSKPEDPNPAAATPGAKGFPAEAAPYLVPVPNGLNKEDQSEETAPYLEPGVPVFKKTTSNASIPPASAYQEPQDSLSTMAVAAKPSDKKKKKSAETLPAAAAKPGPPLPPRDHHEATPYLEPGQPINKPGSSPRPPHKKEPAYLEPVVALKPITQQPPSDLDDIPVKSLSAMQRSPSKRRNRQSVAFKLDDSIEDDEAVTPRLKAKPSMRHIKKKTTDKDPGSRFVSVRHTSKFFDGDSARVAAIANRRSTIKSYLIDAHENNESLSVAKAARTAGKLSMASMSLYSALRSFMAKYELFIDEDFPPDASSLSAVSSKQWSDIEWMRPQDSFSGPNPTLFDDVPSPDDVKQGQLGDCYFLSSLSVLAERPDLIRYLFDCGDLDDLASDQMMKFGCYRMKVCIGGQWRSIAVDDFFPTRQKKPVFSSCSTPESIWVLVAEKVWAKLHTSYQRCVISLAPH